MQTYSWVPIFPDQASTFAWQVDLLYFYLIVVSIAFSIPIVLAIIFFGIKYREKEKFATPEEMHGSIALETTWSIIPFIVSMTIFLGGAIVYYNQYRMPDDAMEIYVVGKQWMWKLQHETGQREINELHIPVGRKIKLTMTTEDVLHDFFVPAFRTKADVVPGRYTYLWFEATKPGKYHLFCAEYCGTQHALMAFDVVAMPRQEFDRWLASLSRPAGEPGMPLLGEGRNLFTRFGCGACHTVRGVSQGRLGPDLTQVGSRRSIGAGTLPGGIGNIAAWISSAQHLKPGNAMPSYDQLEGRQLRAIAAWLESLK